MKQRITIISFIIPIVGFILGIVYLSKDKQVDRKLGEYLLIVSFVSTFIWGGLWAVLALPKSSQPTSPNPYSTYTSGLPQPNKVMNYKGEQVK